MGTLKRLGAIAMMASAVFVAEAMARTPPTPGAQEPNPGEEKIVQGQVKAIDPAGTELTLMDGRHQARGAAGSQITPGAVTEGMTVIASYREQNGENVLTELAVEEPSASPRSQPRSPAAPSTAPPGGSRPRN